MRAAYLILEYERNATVLLRCTVRLCSVLRLNLILYLIHNAAANVETQRDETKTELIRNGSVTE